jgi:exodeoxyribonuclease-3
MRIVSWNLLNGGQDDASSERLERIVGLLREQNPDVVLLQEATGFALDGRRLLYHVENSLDMRGFLAIAKNTGYHLATYVRRGQRVGRYEVDANNFFHAMLRVELLLTDTVRLHLINAHLCPHSSQVRVIEAQHLARYAAKGAHLLIGGDMNSLDPHEDHRLALGQMPAHYRARYLTPGDDSMPDTRVGRSLEAAGLIDIGYERGDQGYTIPTSLPVYGADFGRLRLDYMYLSPALVDVVTNYRVVRTDLADQCSDHYPIMIDACFPDPAISTEERGREHV